MTNQSRELSVFISSTCYDLSQIRADMKIFIESMGYRPVMSDYNSFPVDPEKTTIGSCLSAVDDYTSIFILIVGGRYGSVVDAGHSITNLEYNHAKSIGIPRYVFVQKNILHNMPVWKKNKSADFSDICDSTKLFEFVESLRDNSDQWVFSFERAEDIVETLKHQFSHLFANLISIHKKMTACVHSENIMALKGEAFRLAIEKPTAWEYRLFAQVLHDQIESSKHITWDAEYGICPDTTVNCDDLPAFCQQLSGKMNDLIRLADSLSKLVNDTLKTAWGPPGVPGNEDQIVYVGKRIGDIYRAGIQWGIDFKRLEAPKTVNKLIQIASSYNRELIENIEAISKTLCTDLATSLKRIANGETGIKINLNFSLKPPDNDNFFKELNRVAATYGITWNNGGSMKDQSQ